MDLTEITPENLARKLAEKHENFLKEYKNKLNEIQRISVLQDKVDQISYWIEDGDIPKSKTLLEEKVKTEKELEELKSKFGVFSQKKVEEIRDRISEHESALGYWRGR